nr:ABC transporter substrate-binding protein [Fredinandcohnia onubensis]
MNKFGKTLFAVGMSASLLLAACSSESGSKKAPEKVDVASLPEQGDFSKELELNLSGSVTRGKAEDGNWVQKKLEEKFNVKIENTKVDTWNKDQVSVMVASGDLPDTFAFTGEPVMTPKEFYEQGLTRTIPKEMIEKYAPNYAKMLDEHTPGWQMHRLPGTDDEYLGLTGLQGHTEGILWAPTFRLDWLEKLGIEPPGEIKPVGEEGALSQIYFTKEAYTLEEVEEILKAFTFNDPDGNGKDDTYGISPHNTNMDWAVTLLGSFGLADKYNLMEDGKLVMPQISNQYKEFLKTMARWNDMGLVDPEWTTIDLQKSWEKYNQGKIGYVPAQRSYLAMEDWTLGRAPHNLASGNENVKILATAPEIGPNGLQGQKAFTPVNLLSDQDVFHVSKDVTDEELARILQIFDFINYDSEAVWTLFGEIGTHSEWTGTPGESAIKVKEGVTREEGDTGFWAYNFRTYTPERVQWITSETTYKLMSDFFANPEYYKDLEIRPYRFDLFNETEFKDIEKRHAAQLETIVEEFRMKAITGEIDIDKEWDSYVENWLNNGGADMLAELEKAPLVTELRGE